jgi:hypothetical protein
MIFLRYNFIIYQESIYMDFKKIVVIFSFITLISAEPTPKKMINDLHKRSGTTRLMSRRVSSGAGPAQEDIATEVEDSEDDSSDQNKKSSSISVPTHLIRANGSVLKISQELWSQYSNQEITYQDFVEWLESISVAR